MNYQSLLSYCTVVRNYVERQGLGNGNALACILSIEDALKEEREKEKEEEEAIDRWAVQYQLSHSS